MTDEEEDDNEIILNDFDNLFSFVFRPTADKVCIGSLSMALLSLSSLSSSSYLKLSFSLLSREILIDVAGSDVTAASFSSLLYTVSFCTGVRGYSFFSEHEDDEDTDRSISLLPRCSREEDDEEDRVLGNNNDRD